MTASLRGLAVLAALAVALAIAVIVDAARAPAPVDRTLVPGLDVAHVSALHLTRPGEPAVDVVRMGDAWRSSEAPADPATVDALLSALRGGRWHRRADRSAAGTARATLAIEPGPTIAIGAPLVGADQTWLAIGDSSFLVDDWLAAALVPSRLELRIRHPLAGAASAKAIAVGELRLEGHPRHVTAPRAFWPRPQLVAGLEAALADLEIATLDAPPGGDVLEIHAGDVALRGGGPCAGGRIAVHGSLGDGCVDAPRWTAVTTAAAALTAPAAIDLRPLPIDPVSLVLPGGATLGRSGRPTLDGKDGDPEQIAALVAALAAPATSAALPAAKPSGTITATAADHAEVAIDVYSHALVRRGEPTALVPSPEAWAAITRSPSAYADATRWIEEPTTIASLAIDGTTYTRGAVLGEWTGAKDPALIETLAQLLAAVRAPSGPPPATVSHRIAISIVPPAGASITHHLDVGPITPTGCAAIADGRPVVLGLPVCTAIAALTH